MIVLSSILDPRTELLLKSGQVGVIPTDTIYGLAALASDEKAVARLYKLKKRERKPGTLIAANIQQLIELGLDTHTVQTVARFWPNPLSIVIKTTPALDYLDQGLGDLAVRIPGQEDLRRLLETTGPIITTSANHPGESPANTIQDAQNFFDGAVDFYVDGGDLSGRPPSTVARLREGKLEVLRQGGFKLI